jgi:hypothetical protein
LRLARRSASRRESAIRLALQEIADAQGDVDAFIAQQSEKAKTVPRVAAEIAQRLLEAGRADEAWSAINAVDEKRPFSFVAWTATKLAVSLVGHTWAYMGVMLVTGLVIAAGTYFMFEKPTTNFLKRLIKRPRLSVKAAITEYSTVPQTRGKERLT